MSGVRPAFAHTPLPQALAELLFWAAVVFGVGLLLLRAVNRRGTPGSRRRGWLVLGFATAGYLAFGVGWCLNGYTNRDEYPNAGWAGLVVGIVTGNVVGLVARLAPRRS